MEWRDMKMIASSELYMKCHSFVIRRLSMSLALVKDAYLYKYAKLRSAVGAQTYLPSRANTLASYNLHNNLIPDVKKIKTWARLKYDRR